MNASTQCEGASFESHRRALTGLAYRMLGSRAEAEDVVQDAYLRWHAADRDAIAEPRRYLGTVVTRLCLDRMKSARARREVYVGQWLPEPVVDETLDADAAGDLAHDLSVALMLVLERLSPLERASFLLHDVFGVDFGEIRLCCLGIDIGICLLDHRMLQFIFGLQTGECRAALLEDGLGMIGGRACVAIIQPHQQLAGVNKFVVFHCHLGNETGDVRRDRRHVTADIGVIGALEKAIDGPPV